MASMATIITAAAGFIITAISGIFLIPILRKLKFGQTILEDGPKWHKNKQGTPTMGGIMFIIGIVFAVLIGLCTVYFLDKSSMGTSREIMRMFAGIAMALGFGLVGFFDDYLKVVKKQNLGLKAKQKLFLQIIVTVSYLLVLYMFGDNSTVVNMPFLGQWDMGVLYYPIMGILIVGIVNSANLTDGIDGLLGSVTFVIGVFFMIATTSLRLVGMNVFATALASGCLGFLVFNVHPAKVFMGDTGSLFLGGFVCALAFGIDMPIILFFVGFIYCIESLSVILQVISFKTTGKRIFRMSPIHHHYEMGGMSENKIVSMFCIVTAIMCTIAYFAVTRM